MLDLLTVSNFTFSSKISLWTSFFPTNVRVIRETFKVLKTPPYITLYDVHISDGKAVTKATLLKMAIEEPFSE